MLEKFALAMVAWALASFLIVGYWSLLRRNEKNRAAELAELAKQKQGEADALYTRLRTEVLTPAQREQLSLQHQRTIIDRDFWRARSDAWNSGEI